jgi:hypothetical protein
MPISPETRQEVERAKNGDIHIPRGYVSFIVKWMAFNRAYNELESIKGEWNKISSLAERYKDCWPEIIDLAAELVSIECIGSEPVSDSPLVAPKPIVKSATHFLRQQIGLSQDIDANHCNFPGCERNKKRRICNNVEVKEPWSESELAAVLRLVYQVRCNLMHGEKRLMNDDKFQTNRDRELVRILKQNFRSYTCLAG